MARRVLYELFVQIILQRPRVDKHNGFPRTHKKEYLWRSSTERFK